MKFTLYSRSSWGPPGPGKTWLAFQINPLPNHLVYKKVKSNTNTDYGFKTKHQPSGLKNEV